ncbi:hypothetical protein BY996DRAFT_818368 [Phakopsora pachyrhizi]|nr:hypothetical protein BY996DRAFT_818368 [Phakopsora pachyrhizi]
MKKTVAQFLRRLYRFLVIQIMIGILIAVENELIGVVEDSKVSGPPKSPTLGNLNRAHLDDGLRDLVLENDILKKNPRDIDVTEALKLTKESREKLGDRYQKVRENFELLMNDHRNLISRDYLKKFKETMDYFSILNLVALQRIVADKMKYKTVQLESNAKLRKIQESEILIRIVKTIVYDNLKDLIINENSGAGDFSSVTNFYLGMTEYLLDQKYITMHESSKIFQHEKAFNLLAGNLNKMSDKLTENQNIFFSPDLLDDLINHHQIYHKTWINNNDGSQIQGLNAREKKHVLAKLLMDFSELFEIKLHLNNPKTILSVLNESYKSLVDENFDIGEWLIRYKNFSFISSVDETNSLYYILPLYHVLKAHLKFNPEKLSEDTIKHIVTVEKVLIECVD